MTPTPAHLPPLWKRAQLWLAAKLGRRYGTAVDVADRAVASFAITFAAKLLGDGVDVDALQSWSWWQTVGAASLFAALSVVKSAVFTAATGSPAVLSPVSKTLRARRDAGYLPEYHVPIRPPGQHPSPRPRPGPTPEGPTP